MSKRYRVREYQGYTGIFWKAERKTWYGWKELARVCVNKKEALWHVVQDQEEKRELQVEYID